MEIIAIQNGTLEANLGELSDETNKRKERVNSLAITKDNVKALEDIRTDNNAFIKSVKETVKEAKDKYLEPFTKLESQVLETIKPLEESNKTFSSKLLETKKQKLFEEMNEYYRSLIAPNEDGALPYNEMPRFDVLIQGIPQTLAKAKMKEAIKERLESYQKVGIDVTLIGSHENLEKMKAYARLLNVDWEEN